MPIVPTGSINTSAGLVPDLYVQIVPPQPALNGTPSNIVGLVGTASWGPVNTPTVVGSPNGFASQFGSPIPRPFDIGTHLAVAFQQRASNFRVVRVTDGSDVAASGIFGTSSTPDITFKALYSGSLGNSITVSLAAGGASGSWNLSVALPGVGTETFTNISGTGAAFWVAAANAINNGQGAFRGPSKLITATVGTGTDAASAESVTLSAGTDGASGVTAATLLGSDSSPRTGLYTLRGQGCALIDLVDCTETTQWSVANAFGLAEGAYMVQALTSGTSISAAVSDVQTLGIDSYATKIMHGDYLYWYDQVNAVTRLVSPAAFAVGILAALTPAQSSLNKPLSAIQGSQSQGVVGTPQFTTYSMADLQTLFSAGIDVICEPQPGGNYWGVRGGINSSLNAAVNGDNYTRMTNYISATLNQGMGQFVGRLISPSLMNEVKTTLDSFCANLLIAGLLVLNSDGSLPYSNVCNAAINPPSQTALGKLTATSTITYADIVTEFIVNLQGGQTVVTMNSGSPLG